MQKTKILAVAPYEGMADILTDIAQSRDDIALTVQTGDLFTGRDIAMQLAHKNYSMLSFREVALQSLYNLLLSFPS